MRAEPERAEPERGGLPRRLGAWDGAAVVVTNVIGTGIFLTPAFVAQRVTGPAPFLGLWLLGGLLSLIGALSYAELATQRPRAGGEYVYIRAAFGPLAGFLSGWTSLLAGFSGAIAAAAVGFAIYLDRLLPGVGSTTPLAVLPLGPEGLALTLTPRAVVALGLIAVFSAVHGRGLGPGRVAQQGLAWLNVGTILALVALGFLAGQAGAGAGAIAESAARTAAGAAGAGSVAVPAPATAPGDWLVALVLVMFTYSGWNAATYVAGEFRSPGRTLPRSLLGGTLLVIALYLALNALYVRVLGHAGVAAAEATGDRVAAALWGPAGAGLFTPLILLVLASSVSAMVLTGPRVYYAMARDGCLPRRFSRLGAGGAPGFSIGVQALWSGVLVLSGSFEALLTYTGFAVVLFAGLGVGSVFVLRRSEPEAERPFRVPGYPLAPAAFVAAAAAMVAQSVARAPGPSLAGLALIGAGIPVYMWLRSREGRSSSRPPGGTGGPGPEPHRVNRPDPNREERPEPGPEPGDG